MSRKTNEVLFKGNGIFIYTQVVLDVKGQASKTGETHDLTRGAKSCRVQFGRISTLTSEKKITVLLTIFVKAGINYKKHRCIIYVISTTDYVLNEIWKSQL